MRLLRSSARRNAHIAIVIVRTSITSGIRMRVKRNSPMQVAITGPRRIPRASQKPRRRTRGYQLNAIAESATGIRAAQSLTPKILKELAIGQ